jgi:hypothetical protein
MMRRRLLRGFSWAVVIGLGLALGLLLGGRIQGIAVDASMALALAVGAALLGFVVGAVLPMRPGPVDDGAGAGEAAVAPASAIDLSTPARPVIDVSERAARRERPLRPRTPSD